MVDKANTFVLATVHLRADDADLRAAAAKLKIPLDVIDAQYGLVAVDRENDLYTIRCLSSAFEPAGTGRDKGGRDKGGKRVFADPKIAPLTARAKGD